MTIIVDADLSVEDHRMSREWLPSIWRGDFRSGPACAEAMHAGSDAFSVYDWIDDRLLISRNPFSYPAYCAACVAVRPMQAGWTHGGVNASGSVHPAWTETMFCSGCGQNSRMRAVSDFLTTRVELNLVRDAYIAEQTTPSFAYLQRCVANLIGSEYLGPQYDPGEFVTLGEEAQNVRHEDLTALSFPDKQFDLVVTQDVFEHVPDYRRAFAEVVRVLRPGGRLVFTIPFFTELERTRIRARMTPDGVEHLLPPEIHGNPVSAEGSLCFQNFGWDIIDELRSAGFADAFATMYWGPWQGHLGFPFFVFSATKRARWFKT